MGRLWEGMPGAATDRAQRTSLSAVDLHWGLGLVQSLSVPAEKPSS